MGLADYHFIKHAEHIIQFGYRDDYADVRPKWEDGTPAHTIKEFGMITEFNMARGYFPAMTLRRLAFKSCLDEIFWIYQKKSNNVHDLKSHIWDSWADNEGTIGKAYGYQIGQVAHWPDGDMDQMDRLLKDLKTNPTSRRMITNTYVPQDLPEMRLQPCAYSMTYNVTSESDGLHLNAILNQRSQDMLTANNWNDAQYAAMLAMLAKLNGMIPGRFIHVIADAHIYDRHVPIVKAMIQNYYQACMIKLPELYKAYCPDRDWVSDVIHIMPHLSHHIDNGIHMDTMSAETMYAFAYATASSISAHSSACTVATDILQQIPNPDPKLIIDPKINTDYSWYDITVDDLKLEGYKPDDTFKPKIEVAI